MYVNVCEDNCTFIAMDYNTNKAKCVCNIKTIITQLRDNSNKENFIFSSHPNFYIVKCYELIPHWNFLRYNIGFWMMLTLFVLSLIFILILKLVEISIVYSKIFNMMKPNPITHHKIYFSEEEYTNEF